MTFNVGIDIGGTFTDFCSVAADGTMVTCKTPSTHYDLSVGFMRGMRELAKRNNLASRSYLSSIQSIRYSTTVGTNVLIEHNGPKLGLITTAGFEDTMYIGRARSWADGVPPHLTRDMVSIDKPQPLIATDMVVGVRERVDSFGNILAPLSREEVLEKLQYLVDRGAQGFVVCLLWSFLNPVHEQMIKQIIEEEYPEDYLGSMPVTLSSEISPKSGEYPRMMTAVVNAYIHGLMSDELSRLGNELRVEGYQRPLILAHNTGGSKKVSRTKAILTHNAGPVVGMFGAAQLGMLSGYPNIAFTDMGGTSFDIGVIIGGKLKTHDFIPVVDRWRTNIPAIEVKSIGAGGGSIAWVNTLFGNALEVGPQSAGSMPGPACYDQGGDQPTVTDADVVLGYINPDNYLGGAMLLDPDASHRVIEEKIAKPLGISTLEAAWRIRRIVDAKMGQEVFSEVALRGHDPREFAVFACGGAGATHACGFAPYVEAGAVVVPARSSVFGAFGASAMDIQQVWEMSRTIRLYRGNSRTYLDDFSTFNAVVAELSELALRDLRLEGFGPESITLKLELDMRYGSQYNLTKLSAPKLTLKEVADVQSLCQLFDDVYSKTYSPECAYPEGGINIECFYLTATVRQERQKLKQQPDSGPSPNPDALIGTRQACFDPAVGLQQTPIYDWTKLLPGNAIAGPALIEAPDTTYVIAPDWIYRMDSLRNGILQRPGQK